jgi:hypothetical protein
MSFITSSGQRALMKTIIEDRDKKQRKETSFSWIHRLKMVSWMTNAEMIQQAKIWRTQKRQGNLIIQEYNNHAKVIQGQTWYIFVVQNTDMDCNPQLDPLGLGIDEGSFMVSGMIYWFKAEHNRDAIYKYVMEIK